MCGCEPGFVCTRCTGDLKQDHRLLLEGDLPDPRQEEWERRAREDRYLTELKGGAA